MSTDDREPEGEHDETLQDHDPPDSMDEEGEPGPAEASDEGEAPPDDDDATLEDEPAPSAPGKKKWTAKRALLLAAKVGISVFGLYKVWTSVLSRDGFEHVLGSLSELHWGWFAGAVVMQLTAIFLAILRWRTVLGGQGIRASWGFMFPSFMIGRFWGAFTLGGLGLDGWKLFDVGYHTKKWARPIAVAGVEKVLGQLAFGVVVMFSSIWGLTFIGTEGVILINAFFVCLVGAGLTFLAKPTIFRLLFRLLPAQVRPRLQTLIDAVCAYHGKWKLLAQAAAYGVGVHAFNNLIYVCAARALGVDLSVGLIFFGSSLQIMVTLVPISINGVGLREAAAVALYTSAAVGLSETQAVLIPTVGFAAEMLVSITGILFLFARRLGTVEGLEVEDADREDKIYEQLEDVPEERWPNVGKGVVLGFGAGLLAGMIVGLSEGAVIALDGGGRVGYGVLAYGAVAYGLFCALGGAGFMLVSTFMGRRMKREAVPEPQAYARLTAFIVAFMGLALGAFRVRRDLFHEELVWKSKEGALVFLACAAAAALIYVILAVGLRLWTSGRAGRFMLKAWGSPAFVGVVVAAVAVVTTVVGPAAEADGAASRPEAPEGAPNVLVIVVDTLRADHLPAYGYRDGSTPSLERFAEDAVRYDQAFSNASWTRPSFASILTGRYASSHGVMAKPDALADDLTTLPEALSDGGYATAGLVTNFNVGPYFNFGQGFESYRFLEPEFVLGADDNAAKLLLVQAMRRVVEKYRAARGQVEPGSAYQDAETVNRHLVSWLDEEASGDAPWFMFVGYMDPHDPYFPHPYDGTGYSRAAHQHPELAEADRLRDLYDGEITYWDEQFGRLMDGLRERGLYDDTLIIVTADHGEEFGDHGGFWHGTTLYDEQVHVPLFVKLPGNARAGTHVSHWVQSVDLMPSILAQVGLEVPEGVQGGSIEEGTTRVYAEESHEGNVLESLRELRDFEELKLILANANNPRGLEPVELYRVADDPSESSNVAEQQRETVQALMSVMDEAREQAAQGAVEGTQVEMDEESRRQLCQIGYIDAEICCRQGLLTGEQCRGT